MPLKRILLTLILALAFTAAAQTVEYATVMFEMDELVLRPRNVYVRTANSEWSGLVVSQVARDMFPGFSGSVQLPGFLDLLATNGWRVQTYVVDRGRHIVLLQRSTP